MKPLLLSICLALVAGIASAATNTVTPPGLFVNVRDSVGPVARVPNKYGNVQGLGGDWQTAVRLGWRKLEPAPAVATNLTVIARSFAQDKSRPEWATEVLVTKTDAEIIAERRALLLAAAKTAASNDVGRAALEVLIERSAAIEARVATLDGGAKSTVRQITTTIDQRAETNVAVRSISSTPAIER